METIRPKIMIMPMIMPVVMIILIICSPEYEYDIVHIIIIRRSYENHINIKESHDDHHDRRYAYDYAYYYATDHA